MLLVCLPSIVSVSHFPPFVFHFLSCSTQGRKQSHVRNACMLLSRSKCSFSKQTTSRLRIEIRFRLLRSTIETKCRNHTLDHARVRVEKLFPFLIDSSSRMSGLELWRNPTDERRRLIQHPADWRRGTICRPCPELLVCKYLPAVTDQETRVF